MAQNGIFTLECLKKMTNDTVLTCGYCNQTLPKFAQICPRCEHRVGTTEVTDAPSPTILEPLVSQEPEAPKKSSGPQDGVVPFRPVCRQPRILLCVHDDGSTDGESIRIRDSEFTIGRETGDLVIPDDPKISGKHMRLIRKTTGGYSKWMIEDLESTNGTFVKIGTAKLTDGSEIMVGLRRFVFKLPESAVQEAPKVTQGWAVGGQLEDQFPKLIEAGVENEPLELVLEKESNTFGASASASDIEIPADPTLDPKHFEISRNENNDWQLIAHPSLNGTWFRVSDVAVARTCSFQIGEQRFTMKVQ